MKILKRLFWLITFLLWILTSLILIPILGTNHFFEIADNLFKKLT